MKDNTIEVDTEKGKASVYTNRIFELFDEYRRGLENPDEDIKQSVHFTGGLKAIYTSLFKPHVPQTNNKSTTIDLADVALLDSIWDTYTKLCYSCGIRPTIQRFSVLTGISADTFARWLKGETRANSPHCESYKKWRAECEANIVDAVLSNNVGAIFLAKSCYGYVEKQPTEMIPEAYTPIESPEQIAARHADARLPEKPVLDFDED